MKTWNEMTIEEKMQQAQEYRASSNEAKYRDLYLSALQAGDAEKIADFEKYGDCVHQCCFNLYAFEKQKQFGWDVFEFGDYGWAKQPEFLDEEEIEFRTKKDNKYVGNSVTVGRGPNGVWTYGYNYSSFGSAGGGRGLSVYNKQFTTKEEALEAGMQFVLKWLNERLAQNEQYADPINVKVDYVKAVIKLIEAKIPDRAGAQLTLF